MALVASTAPYRQLWQVTSNVAEDRRYVGAFQVDTTTAAVKAFVRPSAGSAAAAGAGDLFTVTQAGALNQFTWLVQISETCGQPVWVDGGFMVGATTAGTGGSAPAAPTAPSSSAGAGGLTNHAGTSALSAQVTTIDAPSTSFNAPLSNSFYISLVDGAGSIPTSSVTMPTNFNTLFLTFEVCVKPTAVPASL